MNCYDKYKEGLEPAQEAQYGAEFLALAGFARMAETASRFQAGYRCDSQEAGHHGRRGGNGLWPERFSIHAGSVGPYRTAALSPLLPYDANSGRLGKPEKR